MRKTVSWFGRLLCMVAAPMLAVAFVLFPRPTADWIALGFLVAGGITDWLDGWLARRWQVQSRVGAMLDPIADKALVLTALFLVTALSGLNPVVTIPAIAILLREIFVSGLREYLGPTAPLPVIRLAKLKTTVQFFALITLFLVGIFQLQYEQIYYANDPAVMEAIGRGEAADTLGVIPVLRRLAVAEWSGTVLLWVAAGLTLASGYRYWQGAKGHLRRQEEETP